MAYMSEEEQRLQRKLIPLNIVVCIIALVAAVSLIFAPILTIDLGKLAAVMVDSDSDDGLNNPENTDLQGRAAIDNGSEDGGQDVDIDFMGLLKSAELKVSISAMSAAKVAFASEDKKAEILIEDILFDSGLFENLIKNAFNLLLVGMVEGIDGVESSDVADLVDTLERLDNVKSKTEFGNVINDYIGKLEQKTGTVLDAEDKADFIEQSSVLYDKTMEYADNFSLEAMICVMFSTAMNEGGGEGEEASASQNIATSYKDLLSPAMSGENGEEGSMGELGDSFAEMKETVAEIASYYGYIFYAMLFFAAIWLILFLSALRRIFCKNKRFTMWAVKLTGFIPCLLFGILPLALKAVVKAGVLFDAETGAMISVLAGALTTTTWISGACYLLLWLVSIFWAFPIKRKIRQLR